MASKQKTEPALTQDELSMLIDVDAAVIDEEGGSDAAYALCGDRLDVAEFIKELNDILTSGDWGLMNAVGEVTLQINIRKVKPTITTFPAE